MAPEVNTVLREGEGVVGREPLLDSDSVRRGRFYLTVKRLFDIVASLAALIVLSPLFLIVALIIFIDDPHGSPFYSQLRVGKGGRLFRFWKFRSMVVNADDLRAELEEQNEKDGPVFKIRDDPRITRVGRFIRRTSIDELPQLWNVLKGDMSIVGPRPPLPKEVETYGDYERQRLLVTPGLTCYWQACRRRDDVGFDDWVDMDVRYIRERSLIVDVKLILRTVGVVLTGQGS